MVGLEESISRGTFRDETREGGTPADLVRHMSLSWRRERARHQFWGSPQDRGLRERERVESFFCFLLSRSGPRKKPRPSVTLVVTGPPIGANLWRKGL